MNRADLLGLLACCIACVPRIDDVDSDRDGLYDSLELDLGTDPYVADTDQDGLDDGFEVKNRLDPINPDTDGDGYLDGHEVGEGSDPLDPLSRIFVGGMPMWPYNPDKDKWGESPDESERIGAQVPRFEFLDQYGDVIDLYNFAASGKPLLLVSAANWYDGCAELAKLFAGQQSDFDGAAGAECIAEALANGDIHLVTVIDSGGNSPNTPPSTDDRDVWLARHPTPDHPVVLDDGWAYRDWGWFIVPGVTLIDTDTMVVASDRESQIRSVSAACSRLGR